MERIIELIRVVTSAIQGYIEHAESIYSGVGEGKLKKQHVLNMVSTLLDSWGVSDYKNIILEYASQFIDLAVKTYNLTGKWGRKVQIDIKEDVTL